MPEQMDTTVFYENFKTYTDELQPYSVMTEAAHRYTNYDAFVDSSSLHIKRNHSKQLLIMPEIDDFELSTEIFYAQPPQLTPFNRWTWEVYFGYQREKRSGYKLVISYERKEETAELAFVKVDGVTSSEIVKKNVSGVKVAANEKRTLLMTHKNDKVEAEVFGISLAMEAKVQAGIIGIAKETGVTDVCFGAISVKTGESVKKTEENIYRQSFTIPRTDGGAYDYYLSFSVDKIGEVNPIYQVRYELTGGVYNNHDNMQKCEVWNREHDIFWGLYFSFGAGRLYIENGKMVFCDNSYPSFKSLVNGKDIPYCGKLTIDRFEIPERVFIGYDKRSSFCAGNQASDRMYTYDSRGTLLFTGKSLDKPCFFEVTSDPDKEMVSRLPKDSVDYQDAVFHAQQNHYFINTENPAFCVDVYSTVDSGYLTFEAELQDAFFEKIKTLEVETKEAGAGQNVFEEYGYRKYRFFVKCGIHSQGVYHVEFRCLFGTNAIYKHVSAFEIFDDALTECPQETSGLPMIYAGDGCAAQYGTYNLANRRPDFNLMHYITGSLETPGPSESRKTWKLVHAYRRKLMVWMTKRGLLNGNDTYKDYPGVIQNADYLNYIYPGIEGSRNYYRYDLWNHVVFDCESVRKLYRSFLEENPDICAQFPAVDEKGCVDEQKWAGIPGESFDRLITYINDKTEPLFEKQWEEIKAINPKVKRFSYGPYHVYAVNNSGAYDTKWFGFNKQGLSRVFKDGFLQLEDYPYACGYQTHVSAWNMMTIKQEWKDLKIAPELYDSFPPGCPDGATANASPTDGESFISAYQIVTQMYEYLYNTPVFEKGKFRYWDDNILQVYEHISYEPEKRYELILKSWKIYREHKPVQTLKATAFVTEFDCADDGRCTAIDTNAIFNKCLTGMNVVHEVNAQTGLPQGFVLKWDSLEQLDTEQTDILVLPSLRKVSAPIKEQIRKLYDNGMALIATGDVSGLEDIFGVAANPVTEEISAISYHGEKEYVYPCSCHLPYSATDAECVVQSEQNGILYRKDRALLINACLSEVGVDSYALLNAGRANISKIIHAAIGDFMHSVARPLAHAESDCGINLVKTADGEVLLILTDYSPYSNEEARSVRVWFDGLAVSGIENLSYEEHELSMNCFTKDNTGIDGFSVRLRPREVLIFRLMNTYVR